MPKKPEKKTDPKEKEAAVKMEAPAAKGGHTFLKVDRSLRPAGFHCDELNTSYDAYDVKE